ncbi:hypothetical protein BXQ17_00455 [Polaribacter sp. BM10]|uniref:helix-turn-helix transcriptional regulator n=1 Tax=Polaribacter sp. BM10 TaxID=1529069 RepID=UPI00098A2CB3|nr:hypothetical protein [Polaribacter sp. BM10]AQS92628.1 hypothetical protein BXQ17_00455 [Polaribacter sp. BM10]
MKLLRFYKNLTLLLFILQFSTACSQEVLVKDQDYWFYYDKGYLESDWTNLKDLTNWQKGLTPIGYGDKKLTTTISYGGDKDKKHITKYFKKNIVIDDDYIAYEFKLKRDDGAVVYVNGKELFRDNMPNITIGKTTLASSTTKGAEEKKYYQHFFENNIFVKGKNTISISIHQAYEYSSDCIFSLELIGHKNPEILSFVLENKDRTNNELSNKIEILNSKLEHDKIAIQKESLESTNYNLKIIVLLIIVIFILGIFGYYFTLLSFKKTNKEKNKKIASLKNKNNNRDKKIMMLTTNLLHNKQYFKEIKADIKGLKTEDKKTVKTIINQIDSVLERDEDWKTLTEHFNALHNNFYDKLIEKHPNITETELRHCMFIKLHMQTKEIARIFMIDPRSVQTARYRIKKKLNLEENESLRDYLLNFD